MIFKYLIILMLFIYAFATGDVMSVVKYENDKDDLKGTDLVLINRLFR